MNPRDNDRLDQWLDSALQQYRSAEPRAGLEGRILANMAAEKQPFALRLRWGFAVATAAVICGTVVFWFETSSHVPHTNKAVAVQAPIEHRNTSHLSQQTPEHVAGKLRMKNVTARPRSAPKIKAVDLASEPRLEQFPSPSPLSEEEKLLKEFVRNSPQEAVLVAQAQAERQKELDRLMADRASKSESDQQER